MSGRARQSRLDNKSWTTDRGESDFTMLMIIVMAMDDDNYEVHWADVTKKARMPSVHRTTVAKNLRDAGFDIAARNAVPRNAARRPPKRRTPRSSQRSFRLIRDMPVNT